MTDCGLEDYELFCNVAREFNEYVEPERVKGPAATASSDAKGDRPGDEFNRRAEWETILVPHGWTVGHTSGEVTYWTRPDKKRGTSATTGKCKTDGAGDLLYVFSSNADPFEPDAAYSKFAAKAYLDHGGDFAAAAKKLRDEGYGKGDGSVAFGSKPGPDQPDDGIAPDFDFATNADLKRLDLGTQWAWDGWLQLGVVNLIAAEAGMGKTRFVADLCRRVHAGLPWPDEKPTEAWPSQYLAMWVAGDRNHGELLTLSEAFGFGDRIAYSGSKSDPLGGITLNTAADFQALYRKAKAARPKFLFIDTAGGATGYDLAKQGEARAFFAPLSDLAMRLHLCVGVITHLNASKNVLGKRAEERVRVVIRMSAEDREPTTPRRIEVVKSNSLFPKPLGMTLGGTGSEYSADAPAAPQNTPGGFAGRDNGDQERGPSTKARECADWLTEALTEKPRRVSEVRKASEEKGYSTNILYKAKTVAGAIESEDSQGYKWWALKASF